MSSTHSLFRNRFALLASGIAGENDALLVDEVVQSGVWGRLSHSLGQYHYGDGWIPEKQRLNAESLQRVSPGQPVLQHQCAGRISLHRHRRRGSRGSASFWTTFSLTCARIEKTKTGRLGLHHAFAPGSDIIASLIYKDVDAAFRDQNPDPRRRRAATLDEESLLAEEPVPVPVGGIGRYSAVLGTSPPRIGTR